MTWFTETVTWTWRALKAGAAESFMGAPESLPAGAHCGVAATTDEPTATGTLEMVAELTGPSWLRFEGDEPGARGLSDAVAAMLFGGKTVGDDVLAVGEAAGETGASLPQPMQNFFPAFKMVPQDWHALIRSTNLITSTCANSYQKSRNVAI